MISGGLRTEEKKPIKTPESRNTYVVIAYDGSEQSLKALRLAIKILPVLESKLIVLHACEESKCNEDVLEEAKLILKSSGINGEVKMLPYDSSLSSAASEIISFVRQISASLIVIGATGSSCKEYCNLGSTAASIAINSPVSVLIVR